MDFHSKYDHQDSLSPTCWLPAEGPNRHKGRSHRQGLPVLWVLTAPGPPRAGPAGAAWHCGVCPSAPGVQSPGHGPLGRTTG